MPSTLCRVSSHAFRIIASLSLFLFSCSLSFFSPSPRGQRIFLWTFPFIPLYSYLLHFSTLPYNPLPSRSLLLRTSLGVPRPRVFAAFLLASLTPSTTFLVSRLSLSLALANPPLRARSLILLLLLLLLILPPYYRMLVLALTLTQPLASSRSFCSLSSFARRALCTPSVRSSVRSHIHRYRHHRHRHRRRHYHPLPPCFHPLPLSLPTLLTSLSFRLLMRHRCPTMHRPTGYFSCLRHLIATSRLRDEHTYSL